MTGRTFAVLSPFVGGDYYGAIVAGVNAAAARHGDSVVAIQTLDPGSHSADHSGLPDFHRPVAWAHVAGLIILPGAVHDEYALAARRAGKPVVLIGHEVDGDCSSVVADNRSGVREAVAHLITHGHERIAFAGNLSHYDVRERYEGYREALHGHDLPPRADLLFDLRDNHETGGEDVADALVQAGMPATAIVLGTDRNAIGLFRRLTAAGYELPRELAVVGFDDIPDGMYLYPALSTVRQPLDHVGAAAHALAREMADDPTTVRQVRGVPTVFVRRDSCGCPSDGLPVSEPHTRELFADVQYLQTTLNIQYELSIELLGAHGDREPRELSWLGRTTAVGGCLGLWSGSADDAVATPDADVELDIVGEFRPGGVTPGDVGASMPVSQFPPQSLFDVADGSPDEVVFVVPVKSDSRDWGLLAAVGRIQASTPPGREMMNHSGSLLATALDHVTMVQALREQEERLRNAALHDYLTGLPNRVLLADRLRQAGLRVARQPSHRFAVLLLDLDGFKAVNDSFGHAAGDELLVEVAARLTGLLRESDTVARLGGDEFVILLDGVTVPDGPQAVCDAIRDALTKPFVIDGRDVHVGVSIGVALSATGASDPDHLLREADAAMYRVKSAARDVPAS
ncbi:GGDEF domain-containing protein [Actinoplanes sp. NBRC 103695]|uniref:substrate-binding and GGDEF domain-containing protein n=1 Tax=Actinoplanes sp. NBRC 103695 TaxID=3032202 RepID=UPI0025553867|nr:GGDEF domain-containing protein [Actinoplanes sp. NBRC 103695]